MKSQMLGLVTVLSLSFSAVAAAQRPSGAGAPPSHPQPAPQASPKATSHPAAPSNTSKGEPKNFSGVAGRLGTTPQALDDAYKAALQANPKLTRGQFIAANMLSKNLGDKNPAITTQAILDGLAGGKSIGQTLQGLGLSANDAKAAEAEADRAASGKSGTKK
jgi:hypothetical protein